MILDLKTGQREAWHRLQTAAYDHLDRFNELTFDARDHSYEVDGVELPSVTRVIYDSGLISPFAIRDEYYRRRGLTVHVAASLLPDRLDWNSVDAQIFGYLVSYMKWLDESKFIIERQELPGWNELHRYAGTMDLLGGFCPGRIKPSRGTLYLQEDGSIAKLELHNDLADWAAFVGFLTTWRWKRGH